MYCREWWGYTQVYPHSWGYTQVDPHRSVPLSSAPLRCIRLGQVASKTEMVFPALGMAPINEKCYYGRTWKSRKHIPDGMEVCR